MPASPPVERLATVPRDVLGAVLAALHRQPILDREYVLKGSLVLAHVHGSPRPAHDFDFTAVKPFSIDVTDEKNQVLLAFCELLDRGLAAVAAAHGFAEIAVLERVLSEEIPAFLGTVGLRRADDDAPKGVFPREVEVQVTLSEVVCAAERAEIEGVPVRVPVLDDLVAGKMKAFIQQLTRVKRRPHDVYDLWYVLTRLDTPPDPDAVTRYLRMKAANWSVLHPLTRARYHDPRIRDAVADGWPAVLEELPDDAPRPRSLDDALATIRAFADRLALD